MTALRERMADTLESGDFYDWEVNDVIDAVTLVAQEAVDENRMAAATSLEALQQHNQGVEASLTQAQRDLDKERELSKVLDESRLLFLRERDAAGYRWVDFREDAIYFRKSRPRARRAQGGTV